MFFIYSMTSAPSNPTANQPPRCPRCSRETDEERLARYSSGLKRLSEIGLAFAEGLHREVQAVEAQVSDARTEPPPAETPAPDAVQPGSAAHDAPAAPPDRPTHTELGRTFERVARSVRLSYMLEDKLIADFAARAKAAAKDAAEQAVEKERQRRSATKSTVNRVVKEAIQAEAGDQSERDHLLGRLRLRLDQDDIYRDLATKPAEILIARLFRDLGLDPNWDRWQGEEWLNGDDYKRQDEASAPAVCPICGRAPPPVPAAQPERTEPEIAGIATGSDPPQR
jgi:hypothetical protein